jgi:hypothetical protein
MEDFLEPEISVKDSNAAQQLRQGKSVPRLFCNDRDWDSLQPVLRWSLKMDIRPWRNSADSWHFYRNNCAAWNLSGWEALEAAALAGKCKVTVRHKAVRFELDRRGSAAPPS